MSARAVYRPDFVGGFVAVVAGSHGKAWEKCSRRRASSRATRDGVVPDHVEEALDRVERRGRV